MSAYEAIGWIGAWILGTLAVIGALVTIFIARNWGRK